MQRLHEWLDPRGLETNAFGPPSDEERERPAVLALLAHAAGARADRHLPRLLVHRPPGPPGLRQEPSRGARARARPDRLLRADAGRRRGAAPQVLAAPLEEGPEEAARDPREEPRTRAGGSRPSNGSTTSSTAGSSRPRSRRLRRTDTARAPWFLVEAEDERYRELTVGAHPARGDAAAPGRRAGRRAAPRAARGPTAPPAAAEASVTSSTASTSRSASPDADYEQAAPQAPGAAAASSRGRPRRRSARASSSSRAGTRRARAAASAASPRPWTPQLTA